MALNVENETSFRTRKRRRLHVDELVNTFQHNYDAAEEASLKFLGTEVGLENMPIFNHSLIRDLIKRDFWVLLRRSKQFFQNTVESAIFICIITDYITCAARNIQLFDIFLNKSDTTHGIPALLGYINRHWLHMFNLITPATTEITKEQLFALVSLLRTSVNRLPFQDYKDCFKDALTSAESLLSKFYSVNPQGQKQIQNSTCSSDHFHVDLSDGKTLKEITTNNVSDTSIKSCENLKLNIDLFEKKQMKQYELFDALLFNSKACTTKIYKPVSWSLLTIAGDPAMQFRVPKRKRNVPSVKVQKDITQTVNSTQTVHHNGYIEVCTQKKPKCSSDITKYMVKHVNTEGFQGSQPKVGEKKILETTSKENVQTAESGERAVTPPSMTVCGEGEAEAKTGSPITPVDRPTVICLTSPVKKVPSPGKTLICATENVARNAFAIMMQQSKQNSKRKSLFSAKSAGKC